jgi:O-antigen/teichoic acid export membrane protein
MIKSRFSKDVFTLVTGTIVSIIITILASPVIIRLYGSHNRVVFLRFKSINSIRSIIPNLKFELAVVQTGIMYHQM